MIIVGDESVDDHLDGVQVLGAYRAILFDVNNLRREKSDELIRKLTKMRVPCQRVGTEGEEYRDIYWAGRSVFEGYLKEKGITFAINLSAGSRMALAALEDALRTPLSDAQLHAPETQVLSAFRYELISGEKKGVRVAPLTFPPVPLVQPGGKWVIYAGFWKRILSLFNYH